ncbi:MAG: CorA family divalent cation transporter [Eubacteriales bacterium]|nr:CorA family divalent cation transporter [Eubacteriales bacterium]
MILYIHDKKLFKEEDLPSDVSAENLPCLSFLSPEELPDKNRIFQINEKVVKDCLLLKATKFESHEGLDFISLSIPATDSPVTKEHQVSIIFKRNLLLFICEEPFQLPVFKKLISRISFTDEAPRVLTLERIVQLFFDDLTSEDSMLLDSIEDQASALEERLITMKTGDYSVEIIALRKKLLAYKRYYDQLSSISAAIEENDNALFTEKEVRYFRILTNRTERLLGTIDNTQDYLSQIREAYQTQIDINQNSIMKLFTVITAIFLPLTLIVGWYGMNFDMPEYRSPLGYPMLIIVSAFVAIGSFLYFKKHKWF